MDEAESLCDNIAIMINGRFVCYGSPGQLKSRYGTGYTVQLKHFMNEEQLGGFIRENMPLMELVDTQLVEDQD
jgi:ABC-type multidrug transport system ATPase subunit